MEDIVYENVSYKGEPGVLTVNDKTFHYEANATKTSVKCSWARVEKRQLSPETAPQHMIKLVLVSGKTAVFTVENRETLEEMRNDMQQRMEAARMRNSMVDSSVVSKSQRRSEDQMDSSRYSTTQRNWQDEPTVVRRASVNNQRKSFVREEQRKSPCWCLCGSLMCWLLLCCICVLLAAVVFMVYWFALKDSEELQKVTSLGNGNIHTSLPPDDGHEDRYGIRTIYHDWGSEEVTLSYRLSDYILDDSIRWILYDGIDCRLGANDITRSNQYLFIDFNTPPDGGPNLNNKGTGTRGPFELHFTLNKAQISDAPFFTPLGLDKAQLNFCIGLSIDYNMVDYWKREKEVNAVETAIQMNIDLSDFRRIEDLAIKTIVRPKYNRLRARP